MSGNIVEVSSNLTSGYLFIFISNMSQDLFGKNYFFSRRGSNLRLHGELRFKILTDRSVYVKKILLIVSAPLIGTLEKLKFFSNFFHGLRAEILF